MLLVIQQSLKKSELLLEIYLQLLPRLLKLNLQAQKHLLPLPGMQ